MKSTGKTKEELDVGFKKFQFDLNTSYLKLKGRLFNFCKSKEQKDLDLFKEWLKTLDDSELVIVPTIKSEGEYFLIWLSEVACRWIKEQTNKNEQTNTKS